MQTESEKRKLGWFIGSLVVIALMINSLFTKEEGPHPTPTQPQQWQQPDGGAGAQRAVGDTAAERRAAENAAAVSKREADAAAEHERYLNELAARKAEDAARERANYLARYLNPGFAPKAGTQTLGIAAVSENSEFNTAVGNAIAARFSSEVVETFTELFTPKFVSDGLFTETFAGSRAALARLELTSSLNALLLARLKVQYSTNPSLNNVLTANMQLEIVVLHVASGAQNITHTFTAVGAGFKQTDARALAEERLLKQIATDTNFFSNGILPHVP